MSGSYKPGKPTDTADGPGGGEVVPAPSTWTEDGLLVEPSPSPLKPSELPKTTLSSNPHVQTFILKQIEQLRVPATDLLALIDAIPPSGSLSPTHHFSWRAILEVLDVFEAYLWHAQIGTNNHQTPNWPKLTSAEGLACYSFERREPTYRFVNADLSRLRGEEA